MGQAAGARQKMAHKGVSMRRIRATYQASLVGIALMASAVTGCSDAPTYTPVAAGSTVVALGDSLTYGYGASPETAYPAVLARLNGWMVVNAGVNGDTSADVLARLDDITAQQPDLVLLGVGGNDVLQRINPETTRSNLVAIIRALKAADSQVILIAEPHFSVSALFGRVSDNPVYEDVAESEAVLLYERGWSEVLADDSLKSDKIHANAAGYRQFAEGLYDYLKDKHIAR